MAEDLKKKLEERSRQIAEQLAQSVSLSPPPQAEAPPEVAEKPKRVRKKAAAKEAGVPEEQAGAQTEELPASPPEKPAAPPKPKEKQAPPAPAKLYPFLEGIHEARLKAPERKFKQSWDLNFALKGLDLKRPENRMSTEIALPEGRGRELRVGVFADVLAAEAQAKGAALVIRRDEIAGLAQDKKRLKQTADQVDWFLGEVSLMAEIGRSLGAVLGPRGKVPKPIPPKADVAVFIKKAQRSVPVVLKDSPTIHVPIGTQDMADEAVLKNLEAVYQLVKEKLPKGINNIRAVHLKLTMGPPVRLEVK
ncbi:MAG: 50S ribosomal protein L1 [Candidatus Aenigmarchaeota archaeon]|nr:50S ribosomal protein L1 [Candidatus Aenigmarchaeota archaeon]